MAFERKSRLRAKSDRLRKHVKSGIADDTIDRVTSCGGITYNVPALMRKILFKQ